MARKKPHEENKRKLIPHSYTHPVYEPGEVVLVSPRLREIHPGALTVGQQVVVCEGTYFTSDQPEVAFALRQKEQARPHTSLVPVIFCGKRLAD